MASKRGVQRAERASVTAGICLRPSLGKGGWL